MSDPAAPLKEFKPEKKFFIGIDSDGCAFDSMEIKHKECFIPNFIRYWKLQAISKYAREAWEFVNLYSQWRGTNRFPAMLKTFDLLDDWKPVQDRGWHKPQIDSLIEWVNTETKLANPALEKAVADTKDPVLTQTLTWSLAVNVTVGEIVEGVPPFPWIKKCLEDKMTEAADIVVVSATPNEALEREWAEHGIDKHVRVIAGQEMGTKKEHLAFAARPNYEPNCVLMIGDAPGDEKAARANDALFYPIKPGFEDESWEFFYNEALDKFLAGEYAGDYEAGLIKEFHKLLPDTPPWKQ